METGSFMNKLMSGPSQADAQVGDGVTITGWSDRKAGTVIKVTRCTITVQVDKAERVDGNGMSEVQEYTYTADPDGSVYVFRKTKRGWRCAEMGYGLLIGHRSAYYDYSF